MLWFVKDVTSLFSKVDKEYHTGMDKYLQGIGSGSSANENFARWEQCDECHVVQYTTLLSQIYLSVVHI